MPLTDYPNGLTSFGIPLTNQISGSVFGTVYFVDATNGDDDNYDGLSVDSPKATIQAAVTLAGHNDTIIIAPGTYTENVVTLDDTTSRNVTLVGSGGASMPGWHGGVIIAASTSSSPCLQIKASGWKVLGICFKPGATSSGIEFYANQTTAAFLAGTAGSLCRGGEVRNCLFWGNGTGKYGIVFQGVTGTQAPHGINIWNNKFAYISAASGSGIYVAASGNPVYDCQIIGNQFESCTAGISTASAIGIVGTRIMYNSFGSGGTYASCSPLLDVTATATPAVTGGNHVYANGFGCTIAAAAAGTLIKLNGYDNAGGNFCSDGIDTGLYKAT